MVSSIPIISWILSLIVSWSLEVISGMFTSAFRTSLTSISSPFLVAIRLGRASFTSDSRNTKRLTMSSIAIKEILTRPAGLSKAIVRSFCRAPEIILAKIKLNKIPIFFRRSLKKILHCFKHLFCVFICGKLCNALRIII